MNAALSKQELAGLTMVLESRLDDLRVGLAAERAAADDQRISQYAGDVHDRGEESNVGAVADVNEALIGQHEAEVRAIRAALTRIEEGTYGGCVDCGKEIGIQRLSVQPSAERCISCQSVSEAEGANRYR